MKTQLYLTILVLCYLSANHAASQTYITPKNVKPTIETFERAGNTNLTRSVWLSASVNTTAQEVSYGGKIVFTKVQQRVMGIKRHFDTYEPIDGLRVVYEHAEGTAKADMLILKKNQITVDAFYINEDGLLKPVTDEELARVQRNQKEILEAEKENSERK